MYFSIEKYSDKKALQGPVLITFPNSALVTLPTTVSVYPLRGRSFINSSRLHFVILLGVK